MALKKIEINIGDVFGLRTVIADLPRVNGNRYVLTRCACGKESKIEPTRLVKGIRNRCSLCRYNLFTELRASLKTGDTFHDWAIVDDSLPEDKKWHKYCLCQCKCGVKKFVSMSKLFAGKSRQCNDCRILDMIKRSTRK